MCHVLFLSLFSRHHIGAMFCFKKDVLGRIWKVTPTENSRFSKIIFRNASSLQRCISNVFLKGLSPNVTLYLSGFEWINFYLSGSIGKPGVFWDDIRENRS